MGRCTQPLFVLLPDLSLDLSVNLRRRVDVVKQCEMLLFLLVNPRSGAAAWKRRIKYYA